MQKISATLMVYNLTGTQEDFEELERRICKLGIDFKYAYSPESAGAGMPGKHYWISEFKTRDNVILRLEYGCEGDEWTGKLITNLPVPQNTILEKETSDLIEKMRKTEL